MEDIVITKQESLGREHFSKNEIQKEVHVVAKNLPFTIEVASSTVQLTNSRIYAKLYYDSDVDLDYKPVDYVKQEPMTYKVFLDATGQKATIEFRISVLTSQHEDSLFRVKLGVLINDMPSEIYSEAIKVVSKPSQVNKQKRGRAPVNATLKNPVSPIDLGICPITPIAAVKRVAPQSDAVLETLGRLEQQQLEQRKIIEHLVALQSGLTPKIKADPELDFESAFKNFIAAYSKIPSDERPNKLRKVLNNSTKIENEMVNDFIANTQYINNEEAAAPATNFNTIKLPLTLSGILNMDNEMNDTDSQQWDNIVDEINYQSDSIKF